MMTFSKLKICGCEASHWTMGESPGTGFSSTSGKVLMMSRGCCSFSRPNTEMTLFKPEGTSDNPLTATDEAKVIKAMFLNETIAT